MSPESDADEVGDEPVLMASRSNCPVVAGPSRVRDAEVLLENYEVDIILSDDGLQHYALGRQVEIAVVPPEAEDSNQSLLPAGPYREPLSRLDNVDIVVRRETSVAKV